MDLHLFGSIGGSLGDCTTFAVDGSYIIEREKRRWWNQNLHNRVADGNKKQGRGRLTLVSHEIVASAERFPSAALVRASEWLGRVRSVGGDVRLM